MVPRERRAHVSQLWGFPTIASAGRFTSNVVAVAALTIADFEARGKYPTWSTLIRTLPFSGLGALPIVPSKKTVSRVVRAIRAERLVFFLPGDFVIPRLLFHPRMQAPIFAANAAAISLAEESDDRHTPPAASVILFVWDTCFISTPQGYKMPLKYRYTRRYRPTTVPFLRSRPA
jgi:hypothetical protein